MTRTTSMKPFSAAIGITVLTLALAGCKAPTEPEATVEPYPYPSQIFPEDSPEWLLKEQSRGSQWYTTPFFDWDYCTTVGIHNGMDYDHLPPLHPHELQKMTLLALTRH